MAVTVGDLVAKLRLDTRDFRRGASEGTSKVTSLATSFLALRTGVLDAARVLRTATRAIGELAERGGQFLNVQRAFTRITGNVDAALIGLRKSSRGLISDYELMVGLNRSLTLGSANTAEQFGELAETAITLGRALGVDAAFALESLSLGIGRQSRLILDNLGLIVSVEEANEKYAAALGKTVKELTSAEQREAFRTAAMEAARAKVVELGGVVETGADAVTRFNVAWTNLRDTLAVAVLPMIATLVENLGQLVSSIRAVADVARTDFLAFVEGLARAVGFHLGITQLADASDRLMRAMDRRDLLADVKGFIATLPSLANKATPAVAGLAGVFERSAEEMQKVRDLAKSLREEMDAFSESSRQLGEAFQAAFPFGGGGRFTIRGFDVGQVPLLRPATEGGAAPFVSPQAAFPFGAAAREGVGVGIAGRAPVEADDVIDERELSQSVLKIGVNAGQQLMMGIIQGVRDLKDLLKSILAGIFGALLNLAIRAVFTAAGAAAGGPAGAAAGGAAGGGIGGTLSVVPTLSAISDGVRAGVSGISGSLASIASVASTPALAMASAGTLSARSFSPTFEIHGKPRVFSPDAIALDAFWQDVFSKTLRALQSEGFRFP